MHIHSTPEILIVAGPNGAGKTTFALEFVAEQPRPLLSADAIAARLHPLIYQTVYYVSSRAQSRDLADEKLQGCTGEIPPLAEPVLSAVERVRSE